jgi:hypothetical protein
MTRFKELARIERAMRDGHAADLRWAQSYCRSRIEIATDKRSAKYWSELSAKVQEALDRAGS